LGDLLELLGQRIALFLGLREVLFDRVALCFGRVQLVLEHRRALSRPCEQRLQAVALFLAVTGALGSDARGLCCFQRALQMIALVLGRLQLLGVTIALLFGRAQLVLGGEGSRFGFLESFSVVERVCPSWSPLVVASWRRVDRSWMRSSLVRAISVARVSAPAIRDSAAARAESAAARSSSACTARGFEIGFAVAAFEDLGDHERSACL